VPLFQASDHPPFLIDGHQQRRGRGRTQGGNQRLHLGGRLDIAHRLHSRHIVIEENHASQVPLPNVLQDEMPVLNFQATEPDQQHLPDHDIQVRRARLRCRRTRR
jgi:hypothetical protein